MIYLSIVFLVIALILFTQAMRQKRQLGIPSGKIIYTDTSQWGEVQKSLYDPILRLTGKPDYLVRQGKQIIPLEVKSGHTPRAPYDSHIYQLASYCLLVRHEYGIRPDYGIIHYPHRTYAVDFTKELEYSTKVTIQEMQAQTGGDQVNRSHQDGKRCLHCGYRSICDQVLRI